ncbi:MAG: carboxy terminal-processing peptidase [Gammaproteobacteria bacterium]|nr:carboxy terminal-processing peptidase [Gammaproteobacteria bacterium]
MNIRQFSTHIRRFGAIAVIAVAPAWAAIPTVPVSELHADKAQEQATEIILHIVDTYHYKKRPLDDELSGHIFDNFLEALDPNRSFFLRQDVEEFEALRRELDDRLKNADLSPAFDIFLRYRDRVAERVEVAVSALNEPFDFSVDEEYQFDRREAPWSADRAELDGIWRKRVKNDFLNLEIAGKQPEEIRDVLRKRYRRMRTSTLQLNASDVFQSFINAYTTAIEPHTAYFSPRTSENFDISMRLSLEGIGAVLRGETDYTEVQRVVPGGPADLSGQLHAEDKILAVGQDERGEMVDVIGWRLDDVVDLIRGPKGSAVRLEILPSGTGPEGPSRVIHLIRDRIKLEEQAAKSEIIELPSGGRIGVLDIPTFYSDFAAQARGEKEYKSTTRDVRDLVSGLADKKIDGLIVDLRGNGGGSLAEALELTGLFIESGPIVQTRDAAGRIEINVDPDPGLAYGGPLAVLVDRNSASASEIFAGAIQDYHRGIIIGEPTFGKGTVQNIVDLNRFVRGADQDYGRLKTTIAQFYRISGGSNQHKGVVPDIVFPTADSDDEHGERALDNAIPWDQISPASYHTVSAPVDRFTEVKRRHEDRIRKDRLFRLLLEEIKLARSVSDRKAVSLNADKRKAEHETLLSARRRLENEFRIARGLEPLPESALLEEELDDVAAAAGDGQPEERFSPADVLLQESTRILFDLIVPSHRTASNDPPAKKPALVEEPEVVFGKKL